MSHPKTRAAARALVLGLGLLVAACAASAPTRYYTLTSIEPSREAAPQRRPLVIGVGPMAVADYLDRPQIVTRSTAMELQLHDFDMWVETLEAIFSRTLSEDLSALLGTDSVVLMPAPREVQLDYQVEVDVLRFDAMRPGDVMLDAMWRLYGRDGIELMRDGRARITAVVAEPEAEDGALPPPSYDLSPVVAAMSDATLQLARQIATAIATARN
ncbi:MAG TPA: PqiC family protein [Geminicoccaceae bacterium]|nr:PqiC family protein [Geminicoccus sp.]HMU48891.1 PqiC family protein [Geminicoccaceae bacterium]